MINTAVENFKECPICKEKYIPIGVRKCNNCGYKFKMPKYY